MAIDKVIPSLRSTRSAPSGQQCPSVETASLIGTCLHDFPACLARASFRDRHELTRIALDNGYSLETLAKSATLPSEDFPSLWRWAQQLPMGLASEPSNQQAWDWAEGRFENVVLRGDLNFNTRRTEPMFRLTLKPLKTDTSCRMFRRFGADRFLTINLPALNKSNLPSHLHKDLEGLTEQIRDWLAHTGLQLCGRVWRAFNLKALSTRKTGKEDPGYAKTINRKGFQVLYFAESGCDISPSPKYLPSEDDMSFTRTEMTVEQLLQWFMPWKHNQGISYPKAFARTKLGLGLSLTQQTIIFSPVEIIRCRDYTTIHTPPGWLDKERSDRIKQGVEAEHSSKPGESETVMNDGCGRISREAARDIATKLGLTEYVPSAFQARIGGAKGLWLVDTSDEQLSSSERNYWIEIFDSQLKFEPHLEDYSEQFDPARLTFEVVEYSRPLSAASLNFQLIPILVEGETMKDCMKRILGDLLKEDITSRIKDLEEALDSPLKLRKWNQDVNPLGKSRATAEGLSMFGCLPSSSTDRINWFIEHGFEPKSCRWFATTLEKVMATYCDRLLNRGHIGVGRSAFAYIGFDHTGTIAEDEIHLSFSHIFRDAQSGFEDNMLHDIYVLVARLPALHPWDIQKRRAIFRPELRGIRDVVVFSSKGESPLAAALSGGDYDGDTAWVCWDTRIVSHFLPSSPPTSAPDSTEVDSSFDITREQTTLGDLLLGPNPTTTFLSLSFAFNLQPSLLGICTTTHEKLCYNTAPITHPTAISLASLCGLLVDRPKQGINFTNESWDRYRQGHPLLTSKPLVEPAYKNDGRTRQTKHILDYLHFRIAKPLVSHSLARLHASIRDAPSSDLDLTALYKRELQDATSKDDKDIHDALAQMLKDLDLVREAWRTLSSSAAAASGAITPAMSFSSSSSSSNTSFGSTTPTLESKMSNFLQLYVSVLPSETAAAAHPLLRRYRLDALRTAFTAPPSAWALLRASAAFYRHNSSNFVWYLAGRELGWLKASAQGESVHVVLAGTYYGLKLDGGYVKRVSASGNLLAATENTLPNGESKQQAAEEDNNNGDDDDDDDDDDGIRGSQLNKDLAQLVNGVGRIGYATSADDIPRDGERQAQDTDGDVGMDDGEDEEDFMKAVERLGY